MHTRSDSELFEQMRMHLFTAIVGDVLDLHGYHHQFLMPECRPLHPNMVVCGRAMTVMATDVTHVSDPPFGLMFRALDSMKQDEVYLAAGVSPRYALWGELMSTAARVRGASGAVLAGYTRDTHGIVAMDFPVFCYGSYAQDQRGRGHVVDFHVPLDMNGVRVEPGDIVFGDIDGVVVLPQIVENEAVAEALKQVKGENRAAAPSRRRLCRESVLGYRSALARQFFDRSAHSTHGAESQGRRVSTS